MRGAHSGWGVGWGILSIISILSSSLPLAILPGGRQNDPPSVIRSVHQECVPVPAVLGIGPAREHNVPGRLRAPLLAQPNADRLRIKAHAAKVILSQLAKFQLAAKLLTS